MKPIPSILITGLLGLASSASAQVTFILSGTITESGGSAFTVGENFTLTLTSNPNIGEPNLQNDLNGVQWYESYGSIPSPFKEITISGATGSYQPTAPGDDSGDLMSNEVRPFYLSKYTGSSTTGLGLVRGGEEFWFVDAWVSPIGNFATYAADSSVRPENTFINGTYSAPGVVDSYFYTDKRYG